MLSQLDDAVESEIIEDSLMFSEKEMIRQLGRDYRAESADAWRCKRLPELRLERLPELRLLTFLHDTWSKECAELN